MGTKFLPNPTTSLLFGLGNSSNNSNPPLQITIASNFSLKKLFSPPFLLLKFNLFHFYGHSNRFPLQPHSSSLPSFSSSPADNDNNNQLYAEEEARVAVSEILQEFGASKEDSVDIAMRCPKYLAMLIDSVRDLDDWNSSWIKSKSKSKSKEEEEVRDVPFKEKVYYMAKEKGDKGMIPFLESLGMSLPSATHLAHRYLSSHSLPNLIHKVKYVKEMFFSNSDGDDDERLIIIGNNARRMMMHLSISIDEDVQHTLSFFEKIEARRGGLDMLGSGDASFRYLIESFPRLLLLSLESHVKPMVEFLEDVGVPRECMSHVLLLFPPIILYNIKDIKLRMQAFEKVGAHHKDFGRMLLKYPWILSTGIQENYVEILSFFDTEKVPKVSVDLAIKSWPLLLGCSISKLKLMVDQFDGLAVRNKKLGQVIATSPQLLLRKPQEFLQVVSFFKNLGIDEETIGRVLGRCPEIFATSIENTLKKKIDFLSSIGVPKSQVPRVIRKYPELFVCDVDRTLLPRVNYLRKTGLSKKDVAFMVRRFSPLLGYSIKEVFRPKLEFLMNTMEKPLKDVVDYPRYFSYSLERKIKPRYWVLKERNMDCSLKDMLGKNDEEFAAEFMGAGRMLVPPPHLPSMNDR